MPPEGIGGKRPPKPAGGGGIPPALVLSLRYPLCEGDPPYNPLIFPNALSLSYKLLFYIYFTWSLSILSPPRSRPLNLENKTKPPALLYIKCMRPYALPPLFKYNNDCDVWSVSFRSVYALCTTFSVLLIERENSFAFCELKCDGVKNVFTNETRV